MTKEDANKDAVTTSEETPAQSNVQLRWDGSNMKSTYANVCNVSSTREEMTILFGTNQAWHTGQSEMVVELTNRVILNPFAAKRLLTLLGNVMTEYENRFGELELDIDAQK